MKRELAREARTAIVELCAARSNDPHVKHGLRLAVVVAHLLPFDVWTTNELKSALEAAGLKKEADSLITPRKQPLDDYIEAPVVAPKSSWLAWRNLFGLKG